LVASPVTGRPSRGRLNSGTARREPESPDDAACSPDGELLPALRGELEPEFELPPRGVAVPLLLPVRVRDPCSLDRIGASNDDPAGNGIE
jgi:hypothetical protein